jgi:hypothetical protein
LVPELGSFKEGFGKALGIPKAAGAPAGIAVQEVFRKHLGKGFGRK